MIDVYLARAGVTHAIRVEGDYFNSLYVSKKTVYGLSIVLSGWSPFRDERKCERCFGSGLFPPVL